MGHHPEPLHQALLAYCEARGLSYVYSKDGGLTTKETWETDVQRAVLRRHSS